MRINNADRQSLFVNLDDEKRQTSTERKIMDEEVMSVQFIHKGPEWVESTPSVLLA